MSAQAHPFGGGSAINGEYAALLSLGGISEAKIRQVLRCNAALRKTLREALRELPGVTDAEQCPELTTAAQIARGELGNIPSAEGLFAGLCDAARARVVKGADLPPSIKTWAQLAKRAAEYKQELLISTLIHAEHNAEAAAQRPEQIAQTERRFALLSEAGRVRVTSRATTFGQAAVPWGELARYAQARNECVELAALVELQHAKEAKRAAKAPAAHAAPAAPAAPPPPPLPSPRARRKTDHRKRRICAEKV